MLRTDVARSPGTAVYYPSNVICTNFLNTNKYFLSGSEYVPYYSFDVFTFSSGTHSALIYFNTLTATCPSVGRMLGAATVMVRRLIASRVPFSNDKQVVTVGPPQTANYSAGFRSVTMRRTMETDIVDDVRPEYQTPR